MSNVTNRTQFILDETLMSKWNKDIALSLISIDVVLLFYIVVGIIGNILVIYIYSVKLRVKFEDKFFILVLAFMDIIVCFIGTVFSLSRNIVAVNYDQNVVCKVTFFLTRTMATASGILLFGIAVQRYLKVCRPLGRQMSPLMSKVLLLVTIVTAIGIDFPILFFYGRVEIYNPDRGILGYRCGRRDADVRQQGFGIHMYFLFMFVCALSVMVTVTTLYIIIWREIHHQLKEHKYLINPSYRANQRGSLASESGTAQNATSSSKSDYVDITPTDSPDMRTGRQTGKTDGKPDTNSPIKAPKEPKILVSTVSSGDDNKIITRAMSKISLSEQIRGWKSQFRKSSDTCSREFKNKKLLRQQSSALSLRLQKNKQMAHRFSIMFMAITFMCTLTYLPGLIINYLVNMDSPYFWSDSYPSSRRCGFLFLFQMYLANHVANPFIYTFFDKKFREELTKMITCKFRRK